MDARADQARAHVGGSRLCFLPRRRKLSAGRNRSGRVFNLEVSPENGENSAGGRPRRECFLTIDAGKHVAMMSGTDKGLEVRDYFVECERRARQAVALQDFSKSAEATRVDRAAASDLVGEFGDIGAAIVVRHQYRRSQHDKPARWKPSRTSSAAGHGGRAGRRSRGRRSACAG
jgi:hypothetical protein